MSRRGGPAGLVRRSGSRGRGLRRAWGADVPAGARLDGAGSWELWKQRCNCLSSTERNPDASGFAKSEPCFAAHEAGDVLNLKGRAGSSVRLFSPSSFGSIIALAEASRQEVAVTRLPVLALISVCVLETAVQGHEGLGQSVPAKPGGRSRPITLQEGTKAFACDVASRDVPTRAGEGAPTWLSAIRSGTAVQQAAGIVSMLGGDLTAGIDTSPPSKSPGPKVVRTW